MATPRVQSLAHLGKNHRRTSLMTPHNLHDNSQLLGSFFSV